MRLRSCFLLGLQYVCCIRGGEGCVPFALGFQKGNGYRTVDWLGHRMFTGENLWVLVPTFFLHTAHCLSVFDLVVSAPSGRHCVLHLVVGYLKVLVVKGWRASKSRCRKIYVQHWSTYPDVILDIQPKLYK